MCTGCMDIVTMIHDPSQVTDPAIARPVMDTLREVMYARNKIHVTADEMAAFFVILGGELLVWKEDNSCL